MAAEISHKLTEITQLCSERGIRVTLTQYGSKKNSLERTIEMGEEVVIIQISNENDEELPKILDNFIKTLKG